MTRRMPPISAGTCCERPRHRFSSLSLLIVVVASALGQGVFATGTPAQAADRPNIILAMADDQGYGDVAYYGHPVLKTPVMDEMAASGLRFDRFYAAAPVCSPTRGSVLTGRHPNRFGCFQWGHTLRPQEVTVAEALKQAGYTTGHFGKWHVGSVRADGPASPGNSGFDEYFSAPNFYDNNPLMSHNGKSVEADGESSLVAAEAAVDFMRQAVENDQPFLAVVWFGSPHGPHRATEELRKLYKGQSKKLQNYYGEITGIDRALGVLRDELRQLDVADDTLFWYTSDNGGRKPHGSVGGLRGDKGDVYEGGLRVPAVIEWPERIESPRVTKIRCNTVDIYPTLVDLVGVDVPDQPQPLDGISLLPLIEGEMDTRDKALGFWDYPIRGRPVRSRQLLQRLAKEQAGEAPKTAPRDANAGKIEKTWSADILPGHAAWIDGDYKLHRRANKQGEAKYSLYNLAEDPKEQTDLLDKEPERVSRMKAELAAWQKSVIGSLNGEDY